MERAELDEPGRCTTVEERTGSPFPMPTEPVAGGAPSRFQLSNVAGAENVQTFYVERSLPNILFATSEPWHIYFPSHDLVFGCDNSIRSTIAMTPGTVYTVISQDSEATPAQLRGVPATPLTAAERAMFRPDLQLPSPDPYARVQALTRSIIARAHTTTLVGEVQALETWMGDHTEYSTDIPPLSPGEDAVNEFLFGNRIGYCEQISTALAVMLRSVGVPAREATGYVPGPFDPLSDLYEIQAKDAHAWVQVYFPGHGWQSFDPTTYVPLAPANPGTVILSDIWHSDRRPALVADRDRSRGRWRRCWGAVSRCAGAGRSRRPGPAAWPCASSARALAAAFHADRRRPWRSTQTPPAGGAG